MTVYDTGDVVRMSAAYTQAAVAIDPTTVVLKVKIPAGTTTPYTYGTDVALVKDSTGNYHLDLEVTTAGKYRYRWISTGTGEAAQESSFQVRATEF